MKKRIILFVILFDLVLFIGLGSAYFLGVFNSVSFSDKQLDKIQYVYKLHKGAYYKIGDAIEDLQKDLAQKSINTDLWVGVFLDDPLKTKEEDLRSKAGAILDNKDSISEALKINKKIKKDTIDAGQYIYWEFPIVANLSYFIGPMKFYPELRKYSEKNDLKIKECIEIYDLKNKKILFLVKK